MQYITKTIKIISGGQTGAEIGALHAVLEHNNKEETYNTIYTGGTMMKGFLNEKRSSPQYAHIFGLTECNSKAESSKDIHNIRIGDVTLLVTTDTDSVKSRFIKKQCKKLGKELYIYDIREDMGINLFRSMLDYPVINVTGDSESESPGIRNLTKILVEALLTINEILLTHDRQT